ncbi:MAG TPA: APC family permease [Gemmatimonadales bacterium]|jgi:amino acid transporter|nr:APC family permease [Gemmatimonadales bacterium]
MAQTALPRVLSLRDVVLFNITAIVGLRHLQTASQFGPASILLWLLAMVVFFLPSAAAVRELAEIDPRTGGLYRWAERAFGPRQGFLAGWSYWVSNLVYFPALLVSTAAIAAYALASGEGAVRLGESTTFVGALSLGCLWLALGVNVIGLKVGRWLPNIGAYGTWIPAGILILLAAWALATHGSATAFTTTRLLPERFNFELVNFFATITFAFAGLELAPTMGDEIRDPAATLRRGVVRSGIIIAAIYILGSVAVLVALPAERVSVTNGVPQVVAALSDVLGFAWLVPAAAVVALLIALGNLGGVGAWLAGSARLPFAAGIDRALPAAFSRIHPRWHTPHVALLAQAGFATAFVLLGLLGATVRDAYVALSSATVILYFVPYLYLFGAYLRLRRERNARTALIGWLGFGAVVLSIGVSLIPPAVESPLKFEAKVVGGVAGFLLVGWWLAGRGVRQRTASAPSVS